MFLLSKIKRGLHNLIYTDFITKNTVAIESEKIVSACKEYITRRELEQSALNSTVPGISKISNQEELVVSLTTYGDRLHSVHITIECLMQQSLKANKIILYIDKDKYETDSLPLVLKNQMRRGLEIRFVRDIRSYTKLLYALKDFPNACIVTVDDDLIYSPFLLERLWKAHKLKPEAICFKEGRIMMLNGAQNAFIPYEEWPYAQSISDIDNRSFLPEGFGGILYPPHSLPDEIFDEDAFTALSPTVDDIWFRAMSLLKGTPLYKVSIIPHVDWWMEISDTQKYGLKNKNMSSLNNRYIESLFNKYGLKEGICHL